MGPCTANTDMVLAIKDAKGWWQDTRVGGKAREVGGKARKVGGKAQELVARHKACSVVLFRRIHCKPLFFFFTFFFFSQRCPVPWLDLRYHGPD